MKIREIIQTLFPTRTWKLAAIIAGGVLCGLGSYTLYASRAWTYLSDDPATCVNCHIMGPYYATWNHSSHSRNATCNDCHVPHENAVKKWFFKGMDGMRHASVFMMRGEPPGSLTHPVHSPKYQYFIYLYPFKGVRFGH